MPLQSCLSRPAASLRNSFRVTLGSQRPSKQHQQQSAAAVQTANAPRISSWPVHRRRHIRLHAAEGKGDLSGSAEVLDDFKEDTAAETADVAAASKAKIVEESSAPEVMTEYSRSFLIQRWTVFIGIVLGYACFYLTRNSLTYTAPVMVADPLLKIDITQVGAMTSIFPIAYGMSKFVSGVLGAKFSPAKLLAFGLMATAAVNILFGFGTSMTWFCCCWALNGVLQGLGGPSCARILTSWFATKERGTYWGMWNIAHNLGGFAAPIVAGTAARMCGWEWGLWVPGAAGIAMGLMLLLAVKDSPEAVGYPPVEAPKKPAKDPSKKDAPPEKEMSMMENLYKNVLTNPYIWGFALAYFFIYVVRQGITSWSVFYLMKEKGITDAGMAAIRVSGLEVGGLFGSLLAGKLSDYLISRAGNSGHVGKRVQVVMGYTVGVAAMLLAFSAVPASMGALQWFVVFMIGFFLYGPQMLIGLCGAELVGPKSVGASEGFLGWIAYLGAANAGIPLSIIVKSYGWGAYFTTLLGACGLALLLLSPMVNAKSHVQRAAKKAA
eukprot:CAMPEP_0117659088 /NCGR_PEP_ID=MMETSP0804-20121206/6239_1 /TAXON_ID=1074897 /ORGANISM="Tetraselmis astigmatica, Strain CCMP880" /LENGTH=549 /DNA_ID=CAMNT_0005465709 /DNA_START=69 /DNA_END=1718 /DNA_ORIENTATION=-